MRALPLNDVKRTRQLQSAAREFIEAADRFERLLSRNGSDEAAYYFLRNVAVAATDFARAIAGRTESELTNARLAETVVRAGNPSSEHEARAEAVECLLGMTRAHAMTFMLRPPPLPLEAAQDACELLRSLAARLDHQDPPISRSAAERP